MNQDIKQRWLLLLVKVIVLIPLLALGLIFSAWFIVAAVFLWLGFEIYRQVILPGGPW